MESRNKLTMCRLCLCENECFVNVFEHYDMHSYIPAEVITDLLQFQVYKIDSYPHVVCSACLTKLTEFRLFKECCQRSKVTYDNMIVSHRSPEEHTPFLVTIKSEEVIIDSSFDEISEDPLMETEQVSCGPILLKYEVLPFSRDSRPQEDSIDSEVSGNQEIVKSTDVLMQDSPQVELAVVETVTHPKYSHSLENKISQFTSKVEVEADSCNWSISTNDELIFEKTKKISSREEVGASKSGTMKKNMYMVPFHQQEKERVMMEQDTRRDGDAWRGISRDIGAMERREGLECYHCGIVLMSKPSLIHHMKMHGFVNSHECAESGKNFHFNGKLKRHVNPYTVGKPYKCSECNKCFSQNGNLKTHMRSHTASKPYKCSECSKTFSLNGNLKIHMRSHTGSKPYKCAECTKSFSQNGSLKIHMRSHTGSKPYKCGECSKSFSQTGSLKNHMRRHTGSKPYKCAECSKCFSQNSSLKRHLQLHPGSRT